MSGLSTLPKFSFNLFTLNIAHIIRGRYTRYGPLVDIDQWVNLISNGDVEYRNAVSNENLRSLIMSSAAKNDVKNERIPNIVDTIYIIISISRPESIDILEIMTGPDRGYENG